MGVAILVTEYSPRARCLSDFCSTECQRQINQVNKSGEMALGSSDVKTPPMFKWCKNTPRVADIPYCKTVLIMKTLLDLNVPASQ